MLSATQLAPRAVSRSHTRGRRSRKNVRARSHTRKEEREHLAQAEAIRLDFHEAAFPN